MTPDQLKEIKQLNNRTYSIVTFIIVISIMGAVEHYLKSGQWFFYTYALAKLIIIEESVRYE